MKMITRGAALLLCAVFALGALASCAKLKPFDNDLRYRYDYDLEDYLEEGTYKGVEIHVPASDVTDAEFVAAVMRNSTDYAEEDVYDRPCQSGDLVGISCQAWRKTESGAYDEQIDYFTKGYRLGKVVGTPEEIIELGSSYYFPITLGCDELFPGFEKLIIGNLSVGEEKTYECTLPEPFWMYPDLSGAEIKITVRLNYITPPVTVATSHTDEEMTAEEARAYYGKQLIDNRTKQVEEYTRIVTWKKINDSFTVKQYPEKELNETKAALREGYASVATRKVKEQLKVDVVEEYLALAAQKDETVDEYIENDLKEEYKESKAKSPDAFISQKVNERIEAMSADEVFAKYLSDHLGVTAQQFEERIDKEAKEAVKDEMVVYYIARREQIGIANIDFQDYVDTNYVESGDYSSIEQFIAYTAYANGYAASDEILTEEAKTHAENFIKEQMLFEKVDTLVKENTVKSIDGRTTESKMSPVAIVIYVVLGCVLVAAIVIVVFVLRAKNGKTKKTDDAGSAETNGRS